MSDASMSYPIALSDDVEFSHEMRVDGGAGTCGVALARMALAACPPPPPVPPALGSARNREAAMSPFVSTLRTYAFRNAALRALRLPLRYIAELSVQLLEGRGLRAQPWLAAPHSGETRAKSSGTTWLGSLAAAASSAMSAVSEIGGGGRPSTCVHLSLGPQPPDTPAHCVLSAQHTTPEAVDSAREGRTYTGGAVAANAHCSRIIHSRASPLWSDPVRDTFFWRWPLLTDAELQVSE